MSINCVKCVVKNRTGPDLMCDECRTKTWASGAVAFEHIKPIRIRQIKSGYDAAHDDGHTDGSLLSCAAQIIHNVQGGTHASDPELAGDPDAEWHERYAATLADGNGDLYQLMVAAAFLCAEIERRLRAGEIPF